MKNRLLEFYALFTCFICLVTLVSTLGTSAWHVVELKNPEFTADGYEYTCFQSNRSFKDCDNYRIRPDIDERRPPSEKVIEQMREERRKQFLFSEQRRASQRLVQNLIIIAITSAVFFIHWVIARKSREKIEEHAYGFLKTNALFRNSNIFGSRIQCLLSYLSGLPEEKAVAE